MKLSRQQANEIVAFLNKAYSEYVRPYVFELKSEYEKTQDPDKKRTYATAISTIGTVFSLSIRTFEKRPSIKEFETFYNLYLSTWIYIKTGRITGIISALLRDPEVVNELNAKHLNPDNIFSQLEGFRKRIQNSALEKFMREFLVKLATIRGQLNGNKN